MSLTEQEREWLERRKNLCLHCSRYGRLCSKKAEAYGKCMALNLEVGDPDYRDAAEFEARVALWLAVNYFKWFD